ncbi:MAG: cadherin-like domain-containing protein [Burkholderiales bacterium]
MNVTAVNDAPTLTANTLAVGDGATVTLELANLGAADVDNAWATLAYAVTTIANGQFELAAAPGVAVTSFTAQIAAGQVRFVHDGSNLAPSYAIEVTDGSAIVGPFAATIVFNASAAAPPLRRPSAALPRRRRCLRPTPVPSPSRRSRQRACCRPPSPTRPPASRRCSCVPPRPPAAAGDANCRGPRPGHRRRAGRHDARGSGGRPSTPNAVPDGRFGPLRAEAEVIDTKAQLADAAADTMRGRIEVGSISDSFAEIDEDQAQIEIVLGTIRVTGIALSVGAVWWAARAAGLVASLLTTTPAWRHVDPSPFWAGIRRSTTKTSRKPTRRSAPMSTARAGSWTNRRPDPPRVSSSDATRSRALDTVISSATRARCRRSPLSLEIAFRTPPQRSEPDKRPGSADGQRLV